MESAENKVIRKLVRQTQNQGSTTQMVTSAQVFGLKSPSHIVLNLDQPLWHSAQLSAALHLELGPQISAFLSTFYWTCSHRLRDTGGEIMVSFCTSFLHKHTC